MIVGVLQVSTLGVEGAKLLMIMPLIKIIFTGYNQPQSRLQNRSEQTGLR